MSIAAALKALISSLSPGGDDKIPVNQVDAMAQRLDQILGNDEGDVPDVQRNEQGQVMRNLC